MQKIQNQIKSVVTTRQADLQQCQKNIEVIIIEDLDEEDETQWVEDSDKEDNFEYFNYLFPII